MILNSCPVIDLSNRTGLYAESHGIVANVSHTRAVLGWKLTHVQNFWDAETGSEFHYNNISSCWQPHWWRGEPVRESPFSVPVSLLTPSADVGNGWESGAHYCQPHVVCFTVFLLFCVV